MTKNILFRKILIMIFSALLLWSILTSLFYSQIARPVFQKIKSEDLYNQAAIISYLAAKKDNVIDADLIEVLSISIRLNDTGIFITNLQGDILTYNIPESLPDDILEMVQTDFKDIVNEALTSRTKNSYIIPVERMKQEILVVTLPIIRTYNEQNYVIGSVIMMQNMTELKAGFNSLNLSLFISSIFVGLLVIIPVIFYTRRMVKPLTDMRNAAARMVEGDFSYRLEPMQEDNEVSYLVNAFNHLAGELDNNIGKLTNERNQLQLIIDGIAEGIIAVDNQGKVTQSNHIIWLLFHQNPRGFNADQLLKITNLDELFEICLKEIRDVVVVKKFDDDLINCLISPLFDRSNMLIGAVGLFRDVTKSEKLEQTRHEYISNVSHELRTPLTAMRGLLEPLNDGLIKSEKKKQEYYAILLRETIRLSNLINDMLELSRIQTSEKVSSQGPVNLQNALMDMSVRFDILAAQKNISFTTSDLNKDFAAVWGSEDRIMQIMTIIMDNAVKFTPEHGRISLTVEEEESCLSISIQDNGTGIKAEDIPYVFERFYKADKSHNQQGTGLGLSIASELAEQMGHTLSVTSQEGQGSTFTLSMPYARDIMRSEPHLKDVYESDVESDEE